ncbi:MAG: SCO family protein [Myxococcales bacterium]|nr:SCO family protein [Myxococcales bacterium]
MKPLPLVVTIALGAAVATTAAVLLMGAQRHRPSLPAELTPPRPVPTGGDFALASAAGPFRLADHRGRIVVLAFGYTACPDVCPTSLATMAAALKALPPAVADAIDPVFVSVDPERDTLDRLDGYVRYFHPRLAGVTGTPAEVAEVAKRYEVEYARVMASDGRGYSIDHSAEFHVIDRGGRPAARLAYDVPPTALADALARVAASASAEPAAPTPTPTPTPAPAPQAAPTPVAASALMIHDAYVRAVPPGSTVSAAFMMIHNPTATLRAVVAATSPAARTVELHTHVDDGGVMRMRQVERIDVPAHGMATLAPGGYHIMLIDLVAPLAEGTTAPVELVFDDGARLRVDAPVRAVTPPAGGHAHHMP